MQKIISSFCFLCMLSVSSSLFAADKIAIIPLFGAGPPATIQKTGQTVSFAPQDDGALQRGVSSPTPRFIDYGNGTVADKLTGLVWIKNADCIQFYEGDPSLANARHWPEAATAATNLAEGYCGLSDGSSAGDWRLPNIRELMTLVDYGNAISVVPPDLPIIGPADPAFWASTTYAGNTSRAWLVDFRYGIPHMENKAATSLNVICVR